MMSPPISTSTMFPSNPMQTQHIIPMPTPSAAPVPLTVPEAMNLDTIAKLREQLHAYFADRRKDRWDRHDNGKTESFATTVASEGT